MFKFNLGIVVTGVVFGLALLAAPSSAKAECPYGGGYGYAPTYPSYAPSYGYRNVPAYGSNQNFYGPSAYDVRRARTRSVLTTAAVVGAAIAISSNNNNRNRSSRNRKRR